MATFAPHEIDHIVAEKHGGQAIALFVIDP